MVSNRFSIGDYVADADGDPDHPGVVVNKPPQKAADWDAYRNTTVADDNPEYPSDSIVVIVAFVDDLINEGAEEYIDISEPVPIVELDEAGVMEYAFPDERLAFYEGEIPGVGEAEPPGEDDETSTESGEQPTDTEEGSSGQGDGTESELESDGEDAEEGPTVPASLQPVAEALQENDIEYESTGETLLIEHIGQQYEVEADRTVTGEGLYFNQILEIVDEAPDAPTDGDTE